MINPCPYPMGQRLWFGITPSAGSRALGRDYKGGDELRDVHAVKFKTRAGRRWGFYVTVCEPANAEYYLLSFDVRAPRGSFKKEYSKVSEEALWLLCVKVDLSTYICKSRVSAELLAEAVVGMFGDSVKRIELCPVKEDDAENEITERLKEARMRLLEEIEGKALQCRNWIRSVRRRFKERVDRLRVVDANLADVIELKLGKCFENISHWESPGGFTMKRLPGNCLDVESSHGEPA
jgi:uncharacterized protein YnzC (UPF0291/DUF896 family)